MLENNLASVLKAFQPHHEPKKPAEKPANTANQYLHNRRAHLDYSKAQQQGLPFVSGEIESSHRLAIQKRFKLAGYW